MKTQLIAVVVGVIVVLGSAVLCAQDYQGLPGPYNAAPTAIQDQQQFNQQRQRSQMYPRQFMGRQQPIQPVPYGATEVNGLLVNPNYTRSYNNGYVRPLVRTPMYQIPGRNQ